MASRIKVGNYNGSLVDYLNRYDSKFELIEIGNRVPEKRALFKEVEGHKYLIMASLVKETQNDYNLIVSIGGLEEKSINELFEDFERKTEVKLRPAPEPFSKIAKNLEKSINSENN